MEKLLIKIREQYIQSNSNRSIIIGIGSLLVIVSLLLSFMFGGREKIQEADFDSETESDPEVAYIIEHDKNT